MKILIIPDSFKGTMTSQEVCSCIKRGILKAGNADITCLPFSDGGEGFAECLSNACNGNILYTQCSDIYSKSMTGYIYTTGKSAIIECATASGIQPEKDVMHATSYGTGELIKFAVSKGFRKIILGLGGSGCCDAGAGCLSALGAVFKNIDGEIISRPAGADLSDIYDADYTNIVKGINFTFACDVENTLYGKDGAAYIFAPQKGADKNQVKILDDGLKKFSRLLPFDSSNVKGAGAAGGICAALYSAYKGEIKSGFEILSDAYELEKKIKSSDLIVTGEGKTDKQTLMGKLPFKIAQLSKKYGKKCIVISGSIQDVSLGDKMISLTDKETSLAQSLNNPQRTLESKSKYILQ